MQKITQFLNYFVDPNAAVDSLFVKIGLLLSGLMLAFGLFWPFFYHRFFRNQSKTNFLYLLRYWTPVFRGAGLGWLVLFFLRYESIFPFQYRIWVYGGLIPVIVWLIILFLRFKKRKPEIIKKDILKDHYEKYLPKPKRTLPKRSI